MEKKEEKITFELRAKKNVTEKEMDSRGRLLVIIGVSFDSRNEERRVSFQFLIFLCLEAAVGEKY